MRAILISLVVVSSLCLRTTTGQTRPVQQPMHVSVLQLITTPDKFDGQVISVIGFLSLSREQDVLYAHQEDATHLILDNGVVVDRTEQLGRDKKSLDRKYVQIVGLFRGGGKRTMPFVGTISSVSHCELWSDPDQPITRRLREIPGVGSNP
jgi:hypothetical protein